jgi:hypothetical protein
MKVTFPSSWINNDVTAFGSVGRRYNPGIDETKFTVEMMFNQVANTGSHTVVGAVHSAKTTVPFAFYPATTGTGNLKISGNCSIPKYEITSQVGSFVKVVAECWVDNGLTYGVSAITYVFNPTYDGYMLAGGANYATVQATANANSVSDTDTYFYVGQYDFSNVYSCERAFLMYDTSALAGKTITNAYLNIYGGLDQSDTDFNITVTNGAPTYPHNPVVLGDYSISHYAGNGGALSTTTFVIGYNMLGLNANGISWINNAGITKLTLVSSRDVAANTPSGFEHVIIYASEQGANYKPQLVVSAI